MKFLGLRGHIFWFNEQCSTLTGGKLALSIYITGRSTYVQATILWNRLANMNRQVVLLARPIMSFWHIWSPSRYMEFVKMLNFQLWLLVLWPCYCSNLKDKRREVSTDHSERSWLYHEVLKYNLEAFKCLPRGNQFSIFTHLWFRIKDLNLFEICKHYISWCYLYLTPVKFLRSSQAELLHSSTRHKAISTK